MLEVTLVLLVVLVALFCWALFAGSKPREAPGFTIREAPAVLAQVQWPAVANPHLPGGFFLRREGSLLSLRTSELPGRLASWHVGSNTILVQESDADRLLRMLELMAERYVASMKRFEKVSKSSYL